MRRSDRFGNTPHCSHRTPLGTWHSHLALLVSQQFLVFLLLQLVDQLDVASVIFCTSSRPRRSSSSEILWSFSSFFSFSFTSRRTWRRLFRPSSASLWTWRDSSLRRSSVSAGIGTRIDFAVGGRIQPEIGRANRLLDRGKRRGIVRLATIKLGSGIESPAT